MNNKFGSFQSVNVNSKNKRLVLFGRGNLAKKTLRKLRNQPSYIVDNNPNSWGTSEFNLEVTSPEKLKNQEGIYILICTTSFEEVSNQLEGMGFEAGRDYLVSPVINDLKVISDIENVEARLLFTSGAAASSDSPDFGGGLYELNVKDGKWSHEKVFQGTSHGILPLNDSYYITHDELGIVELSKEYKVIRSGEVPAGARPHGIAYHQASGRFFVAASCMDAILIFDKNLNMTGTITLSNKIKKSNEPWHHINDICIVGDSLYASMFSLTGNWKRDIFDGVVLEIDLDTNEIIAPVIKDLFMPHNVEFISGSLTVLDSLRGQIKKSNAHPISQFPGFTRGIGYNGQFYFVGQSRNRNYSKYMGLSQNISMDTSIIVFDERTKVSKSLFLPHKLSEIHAIRVIE